MKTFIFRNENNSINIQVKTDLRKEVEPFTIMQIVGLNDFSSKFDIPEISSISSLEDFIIIAKKYNFILESIDNIQGLKRIVSSPLQDEIDKFIVTSTEEVNSKSEENVSIFIKNSFSPKNKNFKKNFKYDILLKMNIPFPENLILTIFQNEKLLGEKIIKGKEEKELWLSEVIGGEKFKFNSRSNEESFEVIFSGFSESIYIINIFVKIFKEKELYTLGKSKSIITINNKI